jgi:putative sterol carrier protein/predicted hydrocarbon binding protein
MTDKFLYPSEDWFDAYEKELNGNETFREAARKWEWDVILVITSGPHNPEWAVYFDLWHGQCRGHQVLDAKDERKAEYVIEAPYAVWKNIVGGQTEPLKAMMTRKFKVTGSMLRLMRNLGSMVEFARASSKIATTFLDSEAEAGKGEHAEMGQHHEASEAMERTDQRYKAEDRSLDHVLPYLFVTNKGSGDHLSAELRNTTLYEISANVFTALLQECGPTKTLEAVRPVSTAAGRGRTDIINSMGESLGKDAEAVAYPYQLIHTFNSNGKIKPMEIRNGTAIVEFYECPVAAARAPQEICVAMSHYFAEGICQGINPEYEYIWTHHLLSGDNCCRYIVKKKSEKIDLNNLGPLEKTVQQNFTQAELDVWRSMGAFLMINVFTTASVNAIGSSRTVEIGDPFARRTGIELARKMMTEKDSDVDLPTLKEKMEYLQSVFGHKGGPVLINKLGIEQEIFDCPFKNSTPEMCKHVEGVLNGVCEAFNPAYEFTYDRMMTRSDHSCHWVVHKKIPSEANGKVTDANESSAEMLKKRFVRGEITEQEYRRMREILDG